MTAPASPRILHVNALEYGGAAIAARRLHEGLQQAGCESRMLFLHAGSDQRADRTELLDTDAYPVLTDPVLDACFDTVYRTSGVTGSDLLFSTDRPTRDLSSHPLVQWAEVINLHWIAGMVSAPSIAALQSLGKPVVWTLHDQNPFTGGCHYSGHCQGYKTDCAGCPGLVADAHPVPRLVLRRKRDWIDPSALTAVSPSRWLAARATQSGLFQDVRVIANGVPVEPVQRLDRVSSRRMLGLPEHAVILLFGADNLAEVRKGFAHLAAAAEKLISHPILTQRFRDGSVLWACFGKGSSAVVDSVSVCHLGELSGERLWAAYRAADLFVLPTLEDNLPNTMLEAVAAGTPVVAYASGGVIDVVKDGGCGLAVPVADVAALADAVAGLALDDGRRSRLRVLCEQYARDRLSLAVQADAYRRLYGELLVRHRPSGITPGLDLARLAHDEAQVRDELRPLDAVIRQGGEILALRTEVARQSDELRSVHERWRVTRETLHDANRQFEAKVSELSDELRSVHERWRETRETLHDVQLRLQGALALGSAERLALKQRARRLMKRVAVYGTGDAGRRAWEALARCGGVDITGFVDDNPVAHGRTFFGSIVQPITWLAATGDAVAVASLHPDQCRRELTAAGIDASRVVFLPVDQSDETLSGFVATWFPDPLSALLTSAAGDRRAVRVGIFGTGAAAMKVWEALADIDTAEAVWFADNNPRQQGLTLVWLDIIAPDAILSRDFDVVVIGSMSRQPIRQQLQALGVNAKQILTPDVQASVEQIRDQLLVALHDLAYQEVA